MQPDILKLFTGKVSLDLLQHKCIAAGAHSGHCATNVRSDNHSRSLHKLHENH